MEKNKITVDNYKLSFSSKEPVVLEIDCDTKLDITVKETIHECKLTIIGNNNYDIDVKVEKDASIIVYGLNRNNSVNANISLDKDSSIFYTHSVLADKDSINSFNVNHLDDSSYSYIINSGINRNDDKLFFTVNGKVLKNLHNIMCNQDSMIINFKKGNSKVIPNLLIESNDVMASHSSYIGEIDEYKMFYMKSRGIDQKDIEKLIYKSVILGRMQLDEDKKEEFNKIINEWW